MKDEGLHLGVGNAVKLQFSCAQICFLGLLIIVRKLRGNLTGHVRKGL